MSIWAEIHRRSNGIAVRKEDQVDEFKKTIKAAAKQFVEEYVEHKLKRKYSVEEIQEFLECESLISEKVVEKMEEGDQDKFWKWVDEHNLIECAEDAYWEAVDEIISTLK